MSTPAQAEASRANGSQSHGPTSPEGKANSARNSIKHGLNSVNFTIQDPADQQKFDRLLADLTGTYRAVEDAQKLTVERIAVAMWRQGVVDNLERCLMDAVQTGKACAETGGDGLPSLGTLTRYRSRLNRDLKEAREHLKELQAERIEAFRVELEKQQKFAALRAQMNMPEVPDEGVCTNEPDTSRDPDPSMPLLNRKGRRALAKMVEKGKLT